MSEYTRGFSPDVRLKRGQKKRHEQRLADALIVGECPVEDCDRRIDHRESETRQHELNHLTSTVKRIAGKWVVLTDEQKAELAEFVARS